MIVEATTKKISGPRNTSPEPQRHEKVVVRKRNAVTRMNHCDHSVIRCRSQTRSYLGGVLVEPTKHFPHVISVPSDTRN